MKENLRETLEDQITSMLCTVMGDEKLKEEEQQFSFSEIEEDNDPNFKSKGNYNNANQKKNSNFIRTNKKYNSNKMTKNTSNNFFNQCERNNKRFQTVKSININDVVFQKNNYINKNNSLSLTNLIHNQNLNNRPFLFNNNLITLNKSNNSFMVNENYQLHNLLHFNSINKSTQPQSPSSMSVFSEIPNIRSEKRNNTYNITNEPKLENLYPLNPNEKKSGSIVFEQSTDLKTEILIYECKKLLNKIDKIDHFIYSKLQNNFVSVIKTHKGSIIFQNHLKNTHSEILHQIFLEISNYLPELIIDPYANYFCKKFFTYLNQKDRIEFLNSIKDHLFSLCTNKIGTFPLQGIIEYLGSKNEKNIIINSIKNDLSKLCLDNYGCHIIEKILGCFEEEYISFIYDYVIDNFLKLSYNSNGICIIKKIISFTYKINLHDKIKKIIKDNAFELILHPYGNYVIQSAVENFENNDLYEIIYLFNKKFITFSLQKFSSNVVERCLEKSDDILNNYINEVCSSNKINEIMKNNYGNYVIQKALKLSSGKYKKLLVMNVQNNINKLKEKKLILKWHSILHPYLNEIK